jgi:hypothetical protein
MMENIKYILGLITIFTLLYINSYAGPRKAAGEFNSDMRFVSENYQNTSKTVTNIKFTIPESEEVSIKICNILGEEVNHLFKGLLNVGTYNIEFDSKNLTSGIYYYTIRTESLSIKEKIVIK